MSAVEVTAERRERLDEWVVSYTMNVRDQWLANGTPADETMREALMEVAYSMYVPERDEWMPLDRAQLVVLGATLFPPSESDGVVDPADTVELRDALRTFKTATRDELIDVAASLYGVSRVTAERLAARARNHAAGSSRTALYRYYDSCDALLYVGITKDPAARDEQHGRSSKWHAMSVRRDVQWFDTRDEADRAERVAIDTEAPIFNITHAKDRTRALDYLFSRVMDRSA